MLKQPPADLHQIYRALDVIEADSDYIQSELYKKSERIIDRKKGILYYDCTNYYFEIEQDDEFRKYGLSKEHRPNPIVQMGLFMDADGIPLSFSLFDGNKNEQPSMTPLEEKIIKDFCLSDDGWHLEGSSKTYKLRTAFISLETVEKSLRIS